MTEMANGGGGGGERIECQFIEEKFKSLQIRTDPSYLTLTPNPNLSELI